MHGGHQSIGEPTRRPLSQHSLDCVHGTHGFSPGGNGEDTVCDSITPRPPGARATTQLLSTGEARLRLRAQTSWILACVNQG